MALYAALVLQGLLLGATPPPVVGILPAGAIQITASPEHVILGDGEIITLTMRVYNAAGEAEDQAPPILLTSQGSVDAVHRIDTGVFEAIYRPPKAGSPRVAIVLARVRTRAGLIAGWHRIPLWGRGRVTVRTKPASQVLLRIGDTAFGPAESDDRGRASISIVVPPGPSKGVAETLDQAGNTSKRTLDLGIKPFDRLAAFALDDMVVADGTEQSGLLAFTVDGRGVPLIDAPLKSRATRGSIAETLPLAPGVYRVGYRPPKAVGQGRDEVLVELHQELVSKIRVPISLTAGDPAEIQLAVTPPRYRAGDRAVPMVTLRALDAAGNPAPASLVDVTTEGAVLGVAVPDESGGVRIPLEISNRFEGRPQVTVHAQATRGQASSQAVIELVPSPCQNVELTGPPRLQGDGGIAVYTAICRDRFGNVSPLTTPRVVAPPLIVGPLDVGEGHTLRINVRTPVLDRPRIAHLTVETPQARGIMRIELHPTVRLHSTVGPRASALWNYGSNWLVGGGLDWHLAFPLGQDALLVGTSLGVLTSPPLSSGVSDEPSIRRLKIAPLFLEVGYQRTLWGRLVGRAGAGVGTILGAPTLDLRGHTLDSELAVAIAAEATAGLGLQLGQGLLELTVRGGYGFPVHDPVGVGQLSGIGTSIGYRVEL